MTLLVDIGNSRIKWAQQTADGLARHGNAFRNEAALQVLLDKHWRHMTAPEQILVSNVGGPGVADEFTGWTQARWNRTPRFAAVRRSACGVSNAYRDHTQLGIDRWLAILAAWQKYREPVCIIDCGTALTVDAVDKNGRHQGGLIIPGLALMQESLSVRAPGIRPEVGTAALSDLADNTADAVDSGCLTAVVAAIERIIGMLHEQSGPGFICLITGGDADYLLPHLTSAACEAGFRHEPHIVLEGLATFFGRNTA
ncbi:MAG TPA: type III pantothenate kinase [Gammaproteobacteria bacterium]|nr:type III pantothenate kinase [Gammaproteobacteria bacterium]